ncbi:hypothetical protein Hypma_014788, partial [Hypsizygus marmoreus]
EMLAKIDAVEEGKPEVLKFGESLGALQDYSVWWLLNAHKVLNKPAIIKKAFELCVVRGWNLSHECLKGYKANEKLLSLKHEDPKFWNELSGNDMPGIPAESDNVEEDHIPDTEDEDWGLDDSDISLSALVGSMADATFPTGTAERLEGGLMSVVDAEDLNSDLHPLESPDLEVVNTPFNGRSTDDGSSKVENLRRRGTRA